MAGIKGRSGVYLRTEWHKQRMHKFAKGQRASIATEFKKGFTPWCKGKKDIHLSPLTEFKRGKHASEATEFKKGNPKLKNAYRWGGGNRHFNWKGGISFEPYPLGWTNTFKEQIRYRDRYQCQVCGMPEIENGRKLSIHHKDGNKNNITEDNLVSLCMSCHLKLHNRKGGLKWEKEQVMHHREM